MDPLSRAQQLLLQQGRFVADVAYFYGEIRMSRRCSPTGASGAGWI